MSDPDLDIFSASLEGITLIEASAGTGKTWNLSGLYLRLIIERDISVRQLLVVTFTKSATAELRDRIRTRLAEVRHWLGQGGPDEFSMRMVEAARAAGVSDATIEARLDAALASFDEAAIFTIHGFCQRALGQVPFAAGLPFRLDLVPDDSDARLQVAADFWRRHVAGAALPDALSAALLAHRDAPQAWAQLLAERLARPLALVRWDESGDEPVHGAGPSSTEVAAAHAALVEVWRDQGQEGLQQLRDRLPDLNGNTYTEAALDRCAGLAGRLAGLDPLAMTEDDLKTLRLLDAQQIAAKMKKKRSGGAAGGPAAAPRHPLFDAAHTYVAAFESFVGIGQQLRRQLLRALLEEGCPRVRQLKRERRQVAYDDLLYNLQSALADPRCAWLAGALRERYPAALIDEFQDTDPLQYAVFDTIYRGSQAPVFLVGDPKQAIYSFRNADLRVYLQARAQADRRCTLRANQRSVPGLVRACNRLFDANPALFLTPGLSYDPVSVGARRRSVFVDHTESGADHAALRIGWLSPGAVGALPSRATALSLATDHTADEIARLLNGAGRHEVLVDGQPLRASRIAVLVRSHAQGRRMRTALASRGVGSVELAQESVFASPDAHDLEQLMIAVLEPTRPGLLRAALATDLMGRVASDIAALADDEPRMLALIERFTHWHETWAERGVGTMIREMMREESVARRLLSREDGERRLTNLLHLTELLQAAAAQHPAPESLARWFTHQRAEPSTADEAQVRLESDAQLVQIVTVHKSKGLEYDVVFCPYLWDPQAGGERGGGESIGYHDGDRWVMDFRVQARQDKALSRQRRTERIAEDLRLLYVALTRAVHRCHLVAGCCISPGRSPSSKPSRHSMLNWVVAGQGAEPERWFFDSQWKGLPSEEAIEHAWQTLVARGAPDLSIAPIMPAAPVSAHGQTPPASSLRVQRAPGLVGRGWRPGSFSSLLHAAQARAAETAAPDHDALAGVYAPEPIGLEGTATPSATASPVGPAASASAVAFLDFPRGPSAGDCMHAMFERMDFADQRSWGPAIARALADHPQRIPGVPAAQAQPRLEAMLHDAAADASGAMLPPGFRLQDVDRRRRLTELGFWMPAGGLRSNALNGFLRTHGYAVPRLGFATLQGYLNGFIDLTFEHEGRWYVLDWKSNHLGHRDIDYDAPGVAQAMGSHGYMLQALLYLLALHRWLGRRLPGYSWESHVGGALYLFVRGMRTDWARADGSRRGVWHHLPTRATIEALGRLVDGVDSEAA